MVVAVAAVEVGRIWVATWLLEGLPSSVLARLILNLSPFTDDDDDDVVDDVVGTSSVVIIGLSPGLQKKTLYA